MSSIKLPLGQNATWPEVAARLQLSSSCSHDWVRLSMRWKVQMTPRLDLERRKHECRKIFLPGKLVLFEDIFIKSLRSLPNVTCFISLQMQLKIQIGFLLILLIDRSVDISIGQVGIFSFMLQIHREKSSLLYSIVASTCKIMDRTNYLYSYSNPTNLTYKYLEDTGGL